MKKTKDLFVVLLSPVPMALSEEQQIEVEVEDVGPPGSKAPVGESWIGKAPRASASE